MRVAIAGAGNVGLFIAITFGAIDLTRRLRIPNWATAAIAAIVVALLGAVAMHQVRYWKDSETLFTHTLAVTHDNAIAEYLVGQSLQATKPDAAMPHLRRSIALIQPLLQLPNATAPDWYSQAYVGTGTGGPEPHDVFSDGKNLTKSIDRAVLEQHWQNEDTLVARVVNGFETPLFRVPRVGTPAKIDIPTSVRAFDIARDGTLAYVGVGFTQLPELHVILPGSPPPLHPIQSAPSIRLLTTTTTITSASELVLNTADNM